MRKFLTEKPTEAAALAYILLSIGGYVGSTIFYLQIGIWYPGLAQISDYFLAAVQDFYAVLSLVMMLVLSALYYLYGIVVGLAEAVVDRMVRSPDIGPTWRKLYENRLGPWLAGLVEGWKNAWKRFIPIGLAVAYILFPYIQGRALAEHPDSFVAGINSRPLIVRTEGGEAPAYVIGTTSDYAILLNETRNEFQILRRDEIKAFRRSVR